MFLTQINTFITNLCGVSSSRHTATVTNATVPIDTKVTQFATISSVQFVLGPNGIRRNDKTF